eukprot:Rhum_TRINITY_DN6016_c0_g1::Rhum_TRINITY_DN6016_c0_g1_i1::g.18944::m.18944
MGDSAAAGVTVLLIRHAQSEFNEWHGGFANPESVPALADQPAALVDCGITATGKEQAHNVDLACDLLLLSPMRRCRETLESSRVRAAAVEVHSALREHATDMCDFLPGEQPSEESEEAFHERMQGVQAFIGRRGSQLLEEGGGRPCVLAVLCHSDVIFYLTSKVLDGERFGQWVENASVTEIALP